MQNIPLQTPFPPPGGKGQGEGQRDLGKRLLLEAENPAPIDRPLRILHLEDEPDYSDLVKGMLQQAGLQLEMTLVGNYADFLAALEKNEFDIILADYSLPTCTGIQALQAAREKHPDTPFLLVSGMLGEQAAIEGLKRGATDYVLKQWPDRLVPAVRRALQEARERAHRKRVEASLRLQSAALESAANAMVITDRAGTVTWANPAFTRLTGYSTQEIVGQSTNLLKSGRHGQAFYQDLWETIMAGRVWCAELVNRRKDGSLYTEDCTITPVRDHSGDISHFIAVKQDITARKELESQLRQAQKMEAIGQLAGGVAHDFNNLLVVIRGNAELVLMSALHLADEPRECLNQITAAAERAANLTRQLLAFSRKQSMLSRPLDLNGVIANLTGMLRRLISENIKLQFVYGAGEAFVQADAGMMEQVLVNLVVNARDAMPSGGQLLVTTRKTTVEETYARAHPEARAGEFVCLSVADAGTGILPEHLPHIFEPFFTTKEPGKGTGLGLATVYGIVKQHQGWLEVSSRVGQGTTFEIFLPAIPPPLATPASPGAEPAPRGGAETILLVEDDLAVRSLTRRVLETSGYRVWEAANGVQALELWRRHPAEIRLLVTDMVMPDGITGRELAERLLAEKPGLKVLFISGYTPDVAGRDTEFIRRSKSCFLQKPYPSNLLLETVRHCLDEP
ncbi:MAG TPA: response regulator [Candidatus Binatia bacterium]|jgi:two-component system cell cycle sensor histidine kinase/response regulator CckA|nr:response regulator [Candidatus Binatia bacterium]